MTNKSSIKKILDWLLTIPFLITFAFIMVFYDLVQRVLLPFGSKFHSFVNISLNRSILLAIKITGAKYRIDVHEELKSCKQCIIVSNHQSLMDIPILTHIFSKQKPKFIAKTELTKWLPYVSFALRNFGHLVISRGKGRKAISQITDYMTEMKERGYSISIFPEGTRARDGKMKKFRSGGLSAMIKACPDIPVVPVAIDGFWKLAETKLMPAPFGQTLSAKVGEPCLYDPSQDLEEFIKSIEKEVSLLLAELRN